MLYATKRSKVAKNYLLFASNRLERLMSTTNRAFSPATPIDHTYQSHVVFPLRMLELKIGKGRRVIKIIQTLRCTAAAYPGHEARYPTLLLTGTMARGVCALESSSFFCGWHRVKDALKQG